MYINYLLWWQDFRLSTHGVFTPFMQELSAFSISYLLLFPVFIYWGWDKKRGLLTLEALFLCEFLTALIKLTACVYRPWVKDPRIVPAVKSLPSSYSFPSRHTTMGTAMYLGSGLAFWQKKHTKILTIICVILALLTGLSRNYLGVHTPQDVVVGFLLSVGCLGAVWKANAYFEKHPEKENKWLLLTATVCVLAIIYILYKPYPLDYVNGKLLVNPHKMLKGAFEGIGALLAFCAARYIEKTWIRFKETGLNLKGVAYCLAGLLPLYLLLAFAGKPLKHLFGAQAGSLVWSAVIVFYIIALYPLILKRFTGKKSHT